MKKFEYKLIASEGFSSEAEFVDMDKFLNLQGSAGWELVTVQYGQFIFKREVWNEHN